MTTRGFDIDDSAAVECLAQSHRCSKEEAQQMWDEDKAAMPIGAVKIQCTGRNTHKPAFIGWLRLSMWKSGAYGLGMSETGNASNIQNSRSFNKERKAQGNLWPLKSEEGEYYDGVSGESYRFLCGRCRRDFLISGEKLGQAAQIMIVNRRKYLDLSLLPFG